MVTRVGNDSFGREIRRRFEELGIADGTVQVDDSLPTGTVTVATGLAIAIATQNPPQTGGHPETLKLEK